MELNCTPIDERGSEIIQLVFAIPLIILAFWMAIQIIIWTFSAVQFASAAESAAYHVDPSELSAATTSQANEAIAQAIQSRMIGVESGDIVVEDASLDADTADASVLTSAGTAADPFAFFRTESTGLVSFTARYSCPQIINVGPTLVLVEHWQRDRLISRRTEIS